RSGLRAARRRGWMAAPTWVRESSCACLSRALSGCVRRAAGHHRRLAHRVDAPAAAHARGVLGVVYGQENRRGKRREAVPVGGRRGAGKSVATEDDGGLPI